MDLNYAQEQKILEMHPGGCSYCDGNPGTGWEFEHVHHPGGSGVASDSQPGIADPVVVTKLTCRSCGVVTEVKTPWTDLQNL